ncbi:MAG: YesL family protein [Lachnospiraceae bacterium]|nr:YesL family protein [Lachnospiraceae bacterium]
MGKIFDLDSPIMRVMNRIADLLILNMITLICCIPIITIGAALTAMHSVLLKMVRNKDSYIVRSYFQSFKRNFKQATILWLIFMAVFLFIAYDLYLILYSGMQFPRIVVWLLLFVAAALIIIMVYTFALEARFVNTVRGTFNNAVILMIAAFPRSLGILALTVLPLVLLYFSGTILQLFPILIMFGISAPAYGCAALYSPVFLKLEPKEEEEITPDDQWTVEEVPEEAQQSAEQESAGTVSEESAAASETPEEDTAAGAENEN